MSQTLTTNFKLRLILVKLFDKVCRAIKWRKLDNILNRMAQANDNLFFVQIGANDGVIYDPIHDYVVKHNWRGVLVEPVAHYFNQLKKNYENHPNLSFENVAISNKNEQRDFYRIKEGLDFLPEWCNGLGTFNIDVLLTHKWAIPNLEDYVITEQVTCITLSELLNRHAIQHIDVLLIDTEGFDYQIIQQIDFSKTKPSILLYEHEYFNQQERTECEHQLKQFGYKISHHLGNTLAYSYTH